MAAREHSSTLASEWEAIHSLGWKDRQLLEACHSWECHQEGGDVASGGRDHHYVGEAGRDSVSRIGAKREKGVHVYEVPTVCQALLGTFSKFSFNFQKHFLCDGWGSLSTVGSLLSFCGWNSFNKLGFPVGSERWRAGGRGRKRRRRDRGRGSSSSSSRCLI